MQRNDYSYNCMTSDKKQAHHEAGEDELLHEECSTLLSKEDEIQDGQNQQRGHGGGSLPCGHL